MTNFYQDELRTFRNEQLQRYKFVSDQYSKVQQRIEEWLTWSLEHLHSNKEEPHMNNTDRQERNYMDKFNAYWRNSMDIGEQDTRNEYVPTRDLEYSQSQTLTVGTNPDSDIMKRHSIGHNPQNPVVCLPKVKRGSLNL